MFEQKKPLMKPKSKRKISDQELKQLILANPDIILNDPDILLVLGKTQNPDLGENVVDIRNVAINKLEKCLFEAEEFNRVALQAASENFQGAISIFNAILVLLEARSLEEFFHKVLTRIPKLINVDYVRFVQLTGNSSLPPLVDVTSLAVKNLTNHELNRYLGFEGKDLYDDGVVMRRVSKGNSNIYGNLAKHVKSEAIIDLSLDSDHDFTLTFLILGSTLPDMFDVGMETDLLERFGTGFARIIELFLKK